eukprot:12766713-Alexandrium_andersonii.AAC.1
MREPRSRRPGEARARCGVLEVRPGACPAPGGAEARRARFAAILRAAGDPSTVRADERGDESLAGRARSAAEASRGGGPAGSAPAIALDPET